MISKEELKELIEKKGTIFYLQSYGDSFIKREIRLGIDCSASINNKLKGVVLESNESESKYFIPFNEIYEDEKYCDFCIRYKNITRTETINFPTWEEFVNKNRNISFDRHRVINNGKNIICEIDIDVNCWEEIGKYGLSEENYLEVCEEYRKLFLGEVEDDAKN